jgi:hypothetical protein
MIEEHIPGRRCKCAAYSASECGCVGVDWRSSREVELETLLTASEARARELFEALDGQIAGGISGKFNGIFTRDKYRDHFRKGNTNGQM